MRDQSPSLSRRTPGRTGRKEPEHTAYEPSSQSLTHPRTYSSLPSRFAPCRVAHLRFCYPPLMPRPVTLFTGQWADLPLEVMAKKASDFGYDGIELACWGDHFDPTKALRDKSYCDTRHAILKKNKLRCFAISSHLVGQAVCDPNDVRHKAILPARVWGDGNKEGVRKRAAQEMIATARAAAKLGVSVVNGFTGSSVWHKLYFFPPTSGEEIDKGFEDFSKRWLPILDEFDKLHIRFALEVHPTEIAYDIHRSEEHTSELQSRG